MNQPPHMHQVHDYYIYIDHKGDVYKLRPTRDWNDPPLVITLIHKA